MKKDRNIFLKYFLEDEEKEFKEEIKNIRENKNSFQHKIEWEEEL